MRVGLVYDLFEHFDWQPDDPEDADAELEPEGTVAALEAAFRILGHEVIRIGPVRHFLGQMSSLRLDVAMSIAEIGRTRNREAYAPVLFELAGIPHLGSDALTLSLSVDKVWTKELVALAEVPCPPHWVVRYGTDKLPDILAEAFPLFVKPRYEGTAKGILPSSKVFNTVQLRTEVDRIHTLYRQDALIEPFISGAEFTVAVVGNHPAKALPVLQRAVEKETGIGLHVLERKGVPQTNWAYQLPGLLTPELEQRLQDLAIRAYEKIEAKDFARVDFRVDHTGKSWFLEVNTLPTFAPDGSFAILAELMGLSYETWLAEVLLAGLQRLGLS